MHPVFISYARRSSRRAAESLHQELGGASGVSFLDSSDMEAGECVPTGLMDALLGARVVVAFVDHVYFSRWYCVREWEVALAAFDALVRRSAAESERQAALDPVVVALPPHGASREELDALDALPPRHRSTNWVAADNTATLAELVRRRLDAITTTIDERLIALGELDAIRTTLIEQAAIPPPGVLDPLLMYAPPGTLDRSLGDAFLGRADELWRIHHQLWGMRGGMSAAARSGAIEGSAGVGKSQLAMEYFHRFGPQTYKGGLFWVNGEAPLESQFHGILQTLKPKDTPDLKTFRQDGRDAERELAKALHEGSGKGAVLYVVDNVPEPNLGESPAPLSTWCPGFGHVTLLVTSRARQSVTEPIIRFPINVLAPDAAVTLLTREVAEAGSIERTSWLQIAEWVGYLPLALKLLNTVLGTGGVSPVELLHKVVKEPIDDLDRAAEALREIVPAGAVRGITEALLESYLRLRSEAQWSARLVAQFAPDPIPVALLEALGADALSPSVRMMLVSRSFVTLAHSTDKRVSLFGRMHRVLAAFLRAQSTSGNAELEEAARAVVRVFSRNGAASEVWPLLDACRSHAEHLCRRLEAAGPSEGEIASLNNFLRLQRFFGSATDLSELPPAVEAARQNVSLRLELALSLGELLRSEGLWTAARKLYDPAATLAMAVFDAQDRVTYTARSGLGETLRALGEFRQAIALQEEVFALARQQFGEHDVVTRAAREQLVGTLVAAGHLSDARALQEEQLRDGAKTLQPNGDIQIAEAPQTLWEMHNRALTLFAAGDLAGARHLEERVLSDARRLFGNHDKRTLVAMDILAVMLDRLGEHDAARARSKEAVAGFERQFGREHDDTLKAKQSLGSLLLDQGQLEDARSVLEEVLEAKRKLLGKRHEDTTNTAWSLFLTLDKLGERQTAQGLRDEYLLWLLAGDPHSLGAKHREIQSQLVKKLHPDLLP